MARRYSEDVKSFIAGNVEGRTAKELAEMVNSRFGLDFTESRMQAYKSNHKLKSGLPKGTAKGSGSSVFQKPVTDYIHANYHGCGSKEMSQRLNAKFGTNYTSKQLKGFYGNHGLDSGLSGRFEPGHVPVNKGKKGLCAPGCEKTQFRRGNLPGNTKPIGYERVTKDGYIEVKIAMRPSSKDCNDNFVAKHRLVWERKNGPIPEGHKIAFLDGDKTNCDIENLALITAAESLELTRCNLRSKERSLTATGIQIVRVKTAAREAAKKIKAHKRERVKNAE